MRRSMMLAGALLAAAGVSRGAEPISQDQIGAGCAQDIANVAAEEIAIYRGIVNGEAGPVDVAALQGLVQSTQEDRYNPFDTSQLKTPDQLASDRALVCIARLRIRQLQGETLEGGAASDAGAGSPAGARAAASDEEAKDSAAKGQASTGADDRCSPALEAQAREFDAITRRRPAALGSAHTPLLPDSQTTLYMLQARIDLIDRVCPGVPWAVAHRESAVTSRDATLRACRALANDPAQCKPVLGW